MAKRYHQSKLEAHERREEKILKSIAGPEFYSSEEGRDRQLGSDGRMISEDRAAMANLPQNVIVKAYAKHDGAQYPELDDTVTGIDHQREEDARHKKTEKYPWKF